MLVEVLSYVRKSAKQLVIVRIIVQLCCSIPSVEALKLTSINASWRFVRLLVS